MFSFSVTKRSVHLLYYTQGIFFTQKIRKHFKLYYSEEDLEEVGEEEQEEKEEEDYQA